MVAFNYIDIETFKTILLYFVRLKNYYAIPIWNPELRKHIKRLERVTYDPTKVVPELRKLGYKKKLEWLRIPTLQHPRLRGDIIFMYTFL